MAEHGGSCPGQRTSSNNVTIGIPVYIEISRAVTQWFPMT
jgi:hypothetical protein